jgi:hypothetical protein
MIMNSWSKLSRVTTVDMFLLFGCSPRTYSGVSPTFRDRCWSLLLRVCCGGSVRGVYMVIRGGSRSGREGAAISFVFEFKMWSHVWLIFRPPSLLKFSLHFRISSASRIIRDLKFSPFAMGRQSRVPCSATADPGGWCTRVARWSSSRRVPTLRPVSPMCFLPQVSQGFSHTPSD